MTPNPKAKTCPFEPTLNLGDLAKSAEGRPHSGSSGGSDGVSTTGKSLLAGLAIPDANGGAANAVLTAKGACVLGVLGNFLLLDELAERSTVSVVPKSAPIPFPVCS